MSSETIKFTNPTDHTIKLTSVGLDDVPPKGEVDVPLALAAPTIKENGTRGLSPIEKVAPQLQPKDPAELAAWKKVPAPLPQKSLMVTTQARVAVEPAGVVALRAAKAAAKPSTVTPGKTGA